MTTEERRRDREENRQLWRDTQRQINELSTRTLQMGDELRHAIDRLAEESRAADKRFEETDERLARRIEGLAGAVAELITRMGIPPQRPQ